MKLGLFFHDPSRPRYDETRRLPGTTAEQRLAVIEKELDRHAV